MNPYQAWSVVDLEQPSYTKWNILGTNDAYFNTSLVDGWVSAAEETWTYASADDPTYTFTISGDKTTKYQAGMRVRLKQGGNYLYFIITKVSYSSPNTTVTLYGGTDYDLANAAITDNWFSLAKCPFGFPVDKTKWSVVVTDTTSRSQASPTQNTWYNPGSISITAPIGIWDVTVSAVLGTTRSSALSSGASLTLSTANNSESDKEMTGHIFISGASGNQALRSLQTRRKTISLAAKATYYLNISTPFSGGSTIDLHNDVATCTIRLVSSYL